MGSAVARHRDNGPVRKWPVSSDFSGRPTYIVKNGKRMHVPPASRPIEKVKPTKTATLLTSGNNASPRAPDGGDAKQDAANKNLAPEKSLPTLPPSCLVSSKHRAGPGGKAARRGHPLLPLRDDDDDDDEPLVKQNVPNARGKPTGGPAEPAPKPKDSGRKPTPDGEGRKKSRSEEESPRSQTKNEDKGSKRASLTKADTRSLAHATRIKNSQTPSQGGSDTQNPEGRTAQLFMDYITKHVIYMSDHDDLVWFNADFDRKSLQRRKNRTVVWNPLEEIAINEEEGAGAPKQRINSTTPPQPTTVGERKCDSLTRGQAPETMPRARSQSSPRPRSRPILGEDVSHRKQLAKKALEDNVMFINARAFKFR